MHRVRDGSGIAFAETPKNGIMRILPRVLEPLPYIELAICDAPGRDRDHKAL